jgi:hypothetical protein
MMLLWVKVHGGYLGGFLLMGAYFLQKKSDTVAEIDGNARGCLWPVLASLIVLGFIFT